VGAKKQPFRGRGWAIAALLGIVGWWTLREVEHGHAVQLAMAQSIAAPAKSIAMPDAETVDTGSESPGTALGTDQGVAPAEAMPTYLTAQRALASPDPLNPFHWSAATDFGPLYQLIRPIQNRMEVQQCWWLRRANWGELIWIGRPCRFWM
jgi:inner membrane protein